MSSSQRQASHREVQIMRLSSSSRGGRSHAHDHITGSHSAPKPRDEDVNKETARSKHSAASSHAGSSTRSNARSSQEEAGSRGRHPHPSSGSNHTEATPSAHNHSSHIHTKVSAESITSPNTPALPERDGTRKSVSSSARTPSLAEEEKELIDRRLRQAYGYSISQREIEYVSRMQAKGKAYHKYNAAPASSSQHSSNDAKRPQRKILGKDVNAVRGQIVRHVERGVHVGGECDRDYLSGGCEGVISDVCGEYVRVVWESGNARFYYVGSTCWRKDANGNDTNNPRALRCLVLVNKK